MVMVSIHGAREMSIRGIMKTISVRVMDRCIGMREATIRGSGGGGIKKERESHGRLIMGCKKGGLVIMRLLSSIRRRKYH
jgi:hypothetical protein